MVSEWSQLILRGPVRALATAANAIGILLEAATPNTSHINASPAEDVAVTALAPAAAAPNAALMELCSDSTVINSVSTNPLDT